MKKWTASAILALCLLLPLMTTEAEAAATVESGTCGTNLTWVLDSDGVLTIRGTGDMADYAWQDYAPWYEKRDSIKAVVIEDGVTSIGKYAFFYCRDLTSVTIPDSVTSIGARAFAWCSRLTGVTIPKNITSIGANAFSWCDRLTSVTIPDSVTSIEANPFASCSELTKITVGANNTAFCDVDGILFDRDKTRLYAYPAGRSNSGYTIPGSVTSIEEDAFYGCSKLTSVHIPESVTSIGEYAFYSCDALTGVDIPKSVTSIGQDAFGNCGRLSSVTFSGNVDTIGDSAFCDCGSLSNLTFSGNVGTIGNSAFRDCGSLSNLTFSGNVDTIGDSAFYGCYQLSSVTFSGDVGSIGDNAFCDCGKLSGITFPRTVASIGNSTFSNCHGLASLDFYGDVGSVGKSAFYWCIKLSSVNFHGDVGTIGAKAFEDSGLKEFTIEGSVGSIGDYAFYNCNDLTSVEIAHSTGSIGTHAFDGCQTLKRIKLPDGLTEIGNYVFGECMRLQAVHLPDSVTKIGTYPFDINYNLTDIYYAGTKEQWEQIVGYKNIGSNNDGLPAITFNRTGFPEIAAGDNDTLRQLIQEGVNTGLTEVELTADINLGSDTLVIHDKSNVVLDLKGHKITSSADSAFTIVGKLTVKDSTETSAPTVNADNTVSYACTGSIQTNGEVADIQFGGSFTLLSGTVRSSSGDTALTVTGAVYDNPDNIRTRISIRGGYLEAGGPAISLLSAYSSADVEGGVVLSRGSAVILHPEENKPYWHSDIGLRGGTLISKDRGQLSCGIYNPQNSSVYIYGGKIIVENGIGILMRGGSLTVDPSPQKNILEISAGGSGTGVMGSSALELESGHAVVLDEKSGYSDSKNIRYRLDRRLADQFAPTAYPVDGNELKTEDNGVSDIQYEFGPIIVCTITFDSCGGTPAAPATMVTNTSGQLSSLPPAPVREGYVFRGWGFTEDNILDLVGRDTKYKRDRTLYAVWTPVGAHVITFEYYWSFSNLFHNCTRKVTGTDGVLTDWPVPNNYGDYTNSFVDGWFTHHWYGEKYEEDHVFTGDTTVYAHWRPTAPPPYNITFHPNGTDSAFTLQTDDSGKLTNWPKDPVRDGYVFMGWEGYGSYTVGKSETFYADQNIIARWMPKDGYAVRFSLNQGDSTDFYQTLHTSLYARLNRWPDTPMREGYIFTGWYDDPTYGGRLATDHYFSGNIDLYAHWMQRDSAPAGTYVITFDPNGGTGESVLITGTDGRLEFLPYNVPVRPGYTFSGWFLERTGSQAVDTNTRFTEDTTVFAHWTKDGGATDPDNPDKPTDPDNPGKPTDPDHPDKPTDPDNPGKPTDPDNPEKPTDPDNPEKPTDPSTPAGTRYRIYTPGSISGGRYYVSHDTAVQGTCVTITLSPWSNYELDWISATNLNTGGGVKLTERSGDTYTFDMPAGDVEIELSYYRQYTGGSYFIPTQPQARSGPSAWYYKDRHIYHFTSGLVPDGTHITRDMLISVLYNLTDHSLDSQTAVGGETGSSTVWASENRIVPNIYDSGLWGTDKALSRDQAALLIFQYAGYRGCDTSQRTSLTQYTDQGMVRPVARTAVSWMLASHLMPGTSDSALAPRGPLTCGETGDILFRFLSLWMR